MTVYVRSLETAVPPTMLVQTEARDVFASQPGLTRLGSRLVSTCFDSAAIDTRYTAVEEMTRDFRADDPQFFDPATSLLLNPSTKVRNEIFGREATGGAALPPRVHGLLRRVSCPPRRKILLRG